MVRQRKYRSNFCSCNGLALFLLGIASFTTLVNVYLGIISKETTKLLKQNRSIYLDEQYGLRRLNNTIQNRGLNAHAWLELCLNSTLDLCRYPMFPYAPTSRDIVTSTRIKQQSKLFGQRVFGFLEPPTTGFYQFKLSASDPTELWLSSNNRFENVTPIARILKKNSKLDQPRTHISEQINLEEGKQYFIDIINVQSQQDGHVEVQWKLPQNDSFEVINSRCLSLFLNETDIEDNEWRFDGKIPECVACQKKQNNTWNKHFLLERFLYLNHAEVANVLPYCSYKPSYAIPGRKVKQWEAVNNGQITIHTYTNPLTEFNGIKDFNGWKFEVSKVELENIVAKYIYRLHKHLPGRFNLHSVRRVERKKDSKGSRFLIELELERIKTKEIVLLSEYIYSVSGDGDLCYPTGLQWNRTADIYFVVTAKNQGRWIYYLLRNMERIYRETRDEHFNLVIFDYNSTDINLEYAVNETLFSKISFVRKTGKFVKTHAYNEAVETVKDPNAVIFLLDLHYEISSNLITDIRKHVVGGKMVYTPIILRMGCGVLPDNPRGHWENSGFGPIAMYKSDWIQVGGFVKHRIGWGGEDWDLIDQVAAKGLEHERLRTPHMYHYFHSHKGMWKA